MNHLKLDRATVPAHRVNSLPPKVNERRGQCGPQCLPECTLDISNLDFIDI